MIKLTDEFLHKQTIEWPSSSKLAQLLCHVEKKFAKHIGPEEFVQCSSNLIKQPSNYDVPNISNTSSSSFKSEMKKKTCNLENYFEWSNRLRLLVTNEILQVNYYSLLLFSVPLKYSISFHSHRKQFDLVHKRMRSDHQN